VQGHNGRKVIHDFLSWLCAPWSTGAAGPGRCASEWFEGRRTDTTIFGNDYVHLYTSSKIRKRLFAMLINSQNRVKTRKRLIVNKEIENDYLWLYVYLCNSKTTIWHSTLILAELKTTICYSTLFLSPYEKNYLRFYTWPKRTSES